MLCGVCQVGGYKLLTFRIIFSGKQITAGEFAPCARLRKLITRPEPYTQIKVTRSSPMRGTLGSSLLAWIQPTAWNLFRAIDDRERDEFEERSLPFSSEHHCSHMSTTLPVDHSTQEEPARSTREEHVQAASQIESQALKVRPCAQTEFDLALSSRLHHEAIARATSPRHATASFPTRHINTTSPPNI